MILYYTNITVLQHKSLPKFTAKQRKLVMGSWDVFYLNHYTTAYYYPAPITYPSMGWAAHQLLRIKTFVNCTILDLNHSLIASFANYKLTNP